MDLPPVVDFRGQYILCDLRCCSRTLLGVVAHAGRQVPVDPMIGILQVVGKYVECWLFYLKESTSCGLLFNLSLNIIHISLNNARREYFPTTRV